MEIKQLCSLEQVINHTTLSKSSIYRKLAKGEFPAPIKISSRRVAWDLASIAAWINQHAEA